MDACLIPCWTTEELHTGWVTPMMFEWAISGKKQLVKGDLLLALVLLRHLVCDVGG